MSDKKTISSAAATVAAARLSRRSMLRAAAAVGAVGVASPFVSRRALAAQEVNLYAWAGYFSDDLLKSFTDKTGIKANYTTYGTNDELLNTLRASGGSGHDLILPSVDRVPNYVEYDLVQPLDESKINWDGVEASAVKGSESTGGVVGGKRYMAPTDWGTEALAFNTKEAPLKYGTASYGDLWKPEYEGKVTVRGHSGLIGLALYLQAEGKLPHPVLDMYKDEKVARANFDAILKVAVEHKKSIAQFWTNENEAQGAFRTNGCVIGQTWDSTAYQLAKDGQPVSYVAPKEGALAWMEGLVMPKGAVNAEAAYEFINFFYTPEAGASFAALTGYNATSKGAAALLPEASKKFFADAYPGDALDKLWWWPIQESWYVAIRNEYQDRYLSA
jgi:spermidine/putrescine transport system substrate-binding protein